MKALGEYVVCTIIKKHTSKGGLALPENMKRDENEALVHSVGPDVPASCGIKVGDKVCFVQFDGIQHGTDYYVASYKCFGAVIEE